MRSIAAAWAAAVVCLGLPVHAGAQSASDQAAAEALFKQGRDLMSASQFSEACPKFAESERLDPAPGTLLNLATCYERAGQIASAWVTYKEAATMARKSDQPERARLARDKAAELEPRLPTLTIVVPAASDRPDLEVRRDGEVVGRPEWGTPIPVDPGTHVVDATAPGHKAWQGRAQLAAAAAKQSIELPPLEPLPPAPESPSPPIGAAPAPAPAPTAPPRAELPAPPPPAAPPPSAGQRAAGAVVGGVGVAGLVAGGILGGLAISDHNKADAHCIAGGGGVVCDGSGYSSTRDALHVATGSTIAVIAGGALTLAGVIVFATAPTRASTGSTWRLAPYAGDREAGLGLGGSF